MMESSNQQSDAKLRRTTLVAGLILALPPALALTAAIAPGYVPVPFVEINDPAAVRPVLIGVGLLMLVLNGGFLLVIRNYLTRD